ncbi:Capsular polysaccharide biosynthesis protein [Marinibacterium anthonyi]|nr:Capsular polysaccharide biosynthesis protein [Marinibacterium anthonyi]
MAQPTGNLAQTLPDADATLLNTLGQRIRNGDTPPLMRLLDLKTRLKAGAGPNQAFRLYRDTLMPGPGVSLRRQPLVTLRERAETEALALHVVHEGGREIASQPPDHLGAPLMAPPLKGRSRKVFVACFANATVHARSSAVRMSDGIFAFDLQPGELGRIPVNMAFDPVVFDQTGTDFQCIDDQRHTTRLHLPEAFSLLGCDTVAFGHWIGEQFQHYVLARQFPDVARVPILIDQGIPEQHKQSIVAFCGPDHPIIEVPRYLRVQADRMWVACNWFYSPKLMVTDKGADPNALVVPSADVAPILRAAMEDLDRLHDLPPARDAVFITRDPERYRHISNQAEITGMLEAAGYRTIRPEHLSFVDQVRTYRGASRIVVQSGSAMLGLIMCRPGTKIRLLTHGMQPFGAILGDFFHQMDLDLRMIVGQTVDHDRVYSDKSSYRIDPALLADVIERTPAQGGGE